MSKENKVNDLENMKVPEVNMPLFQKQLRLTLLNTKRSAVWGAVLMLFPVYFASAMIFKYNLGIGFLYPPIEYLLGFGIFESLSPLILLGGLVAAITLNLLSIVHISFDGDESEFMMNISIKKKTTNLIVLGISGGFFLIFMLYGFLENWTR